MNLHGIVSGNIGAVNPQLVAAVTISTGYATDGKGARVPTTQTFGSVPVQIQPLTYKDLELQDVLNLNGTRRSIYLYGAFNGVVRPQMKGGDKIVVGGTGPNAGTWLVALVFEQWPDWCRVAATLQNV